MRENTAKLENKIMAGNLQSWNADREQLDMRESNETIIMEIMKENKELKANVHQT